MLEHVLRYTSQDQTRHSAFAMCTEGDGVHLLALRYVAYHHGDWVCRLNDLAANRQTLYGQEFRTARKICLSLANLRFNFVGVQRHEDALGALAGRYGLSGHDEERSGGVLQHLFSDAAVQPPIEAMPLMAGHDNQVCVFGPGGVDDSLCRALGAQYGSRIDAFSAQRTHDLGELAFNRTLTCPA
jgi:hypothetical protein